MSSAYVTQDDAQREAARRSYTTDPRHAEGSRRRYYIIENVVGAPLQNPFMLCGTQFGLGIESAQLRRHRLFETNTGLAFTRRCKHRGAAIGVYGGGHGVSLHRHARGERCHTASQQRVAMGMDWGAGDELSQAIPPAYSEFIARAFLAQRNQEVA